MASVNIGQEALSRRESARNPDGRFGSQPQAEVDISLTAGDLADDLASIDSAEADTYSGEVARMSAARETLRQGLRSTFPQAAKVTTHPDEGLVAAYDTAGTQVADLRDESAYPGETTRAQFDEAFRAGQGQGRFGTARRAVWGDGALELDEPDWDPRTDGWDEDFAQVDSLVHPATDHLSDDEFYAPAVAVEEAVENVDDRSGDEEVSAAVQSISDMISTYRPEVAAVGFEVDSDGYYISRAHDHDGNEVDMNTGWPRDMDSEEITWPANHVLSRAYPRRVQPGQKGFTAHGSDYWLEVSS